MKVAIINKQYELDMINLEDAAAVREEIAKTAINYDGIQHLQHKGDLFQWGDAWLCEGGICPTPDGKGNLISVEIPELRKPEGHFYVTTRRGKQFNSMIYGEIGRASCRERV